MKTASAYAMRRVCARHASAENAGLQECEVARIVVELR